MPLESGTTIQDLDNTYPLAADPTNRGDDHLRLIKSVLKSTFPGAAGQGFAEPITATEDEINFLSGVTSSIQSQIDNIFSTIQNKIYPVGSIYTNATNNTNPATLLGFGTWQAFGAGRVMVGFNSGDSLFNAAEKTGGSKNAVVVAHNHSASTAASGNHSHQYTIRQHLQESSSNAPVGSQTIGGSYKGTTDAAGSHTHGVTVNSTGESGANKNVQPYITVFIWKRTA